MVEFGTWPLCSGLLSPSMRVGLSRPRSCGVGNIVSDTLNTRIFGCPDAMSRGSRHKEDAVKLSTKGRYAVMAMVDRARHAQPKPVSLSHIAPRQAISPSYC